MTSPQSQIVLVPVDGSRESLQAVPLARIVAAQLHCIPSILHVAGEVLPEDKARADLGLRTPVLQQLPLRLRIGDPADCILEESAHAEVQLLVMTTVAAGDPDRELGSVAMRVMLGTDRPLLGLRPQPGIDPSAVAPPLNRVLLPLDGSRSTASALRPVTDLARRLGASVDLVYIVPSISPSAAEARGSMTVPRYVDQVHHEWGSWANEIKERLLVECAGFAPGADIGVQVRQGEPGAEIVRCGREGRYDAIVLVRRSKLKPGRSAVLRSVIQQSTCPLLIVGGPE